MFDSIQTAVSTAVCFILGKTINRCLYPVHLRIMFLLIDNYDSFTYILHHYLLHAHQEVQVVKNDEITISEIDKMRPDRIILSPGPGHPQDAGITMSVIKNFIDTIPILGVCLGHQALALHLGAKIQQAKMPMHGKVSDIQLVNYSLFKELPQQIKVMRYHSLIVTNWDCAQLTPLALTQEQELMAFSHARYPCIGVQFHPESILTEYGMQIILNWVNLKFF